MHRRGAAPPALLLVVAALVGIALGPSAAAASTPDPPPPPATVNEFIPEDRNLGDCLGTLERPGCGSEERGGWHQTAVFAAMVGGLGVVFWRVAVGVRRNRPDPGPPDPA